MCLVFEPTPRADDAEGAVFCPWTRLFRNTVNKQLKNPGLLTVSGNALPRQDEFAPACSAVPPLPQMG
jgi:hypothetical protein